MADPVVTITNGIPTAGTGTITTLGQTLVDGANATLGVTTGAAVTTSVAGTIQGYLRGIVSLLVSGITVTSHAVTNAGTFAVQAAATLAAETTKVIGTVNLSAGQTLGTVTTVGAVTAITNALPAGTNLLGKADIQIAGAAPDVGSGTGGTKTLRTILDTASPGIIATGTAGSPSATVLSTQGVVGGTPQPNLPTLTAAANGLTKSRVNAAATTNATSLKASAGNVASIAVFNTAAYAVFLKLYNKASAPTVGTDAPVWTIPIAAGGGFAEKFPEGDSFSTGIAYAITKLQADSDTTVVVAGDLTGQIRWI